jgi:BspA type Leucine rich repeat region (6 copies)
MLTNFSVEAANPAYSSLNGVLFDKAQTTLIAFPLGRGGSYVIPNSVTHIVDRAFSGCTGLTNVIIGNSVTNIGGSAFSGCTNLTSATIPNSVTSIGVGAFHFCRGLTNVIIGNSVTSIGGSAFSGCTRLTRVKIPSSVAILGDAAFFQCTSLTNFTFLGNAPALLPDWHVGGFTQFGGVGAGAKAYYYCGTTGWGATYGGWPPLPTVMLCPPQIAPGSAGMKPGGFGFTLTCLTNQTIVVEASTNLVNWQPIWTNSPPGASNNFLDPEWVNHPRRFYRSRSD